MTRGKAASMLGIGFVVVAMLGGCFGEDPMTPTGVGPSGGVFVFLNGAVVIEVPPGALTDSIQLSVTAAAGFPAVSTLVAGTAVAMSPDGVQFATPVRLTVNYGAFGLPGGVREPELGAYRLVGDQWEEASDAMIDLGTQSLTVSIPSLGVYAVLGAPAASIEITPTTLTIPAGAMQQLSATVMDAVGDPLPDRRVRWSSSDTTVVTVDAGGLARGRRIGTATIAASVELVSREFVATVTSSGGGGGQDPAPWFEEDFGTYRSTSDMLADPRGIYLETESSNTQQMSLDVTLGVAELGLTQSLKYTFPDRTAAPNRCNDYSIARSVILPRRVSEIWVEVYLMFPPEFRTRAPSGWACSSNPDYKLLFGQTDRGRFDIKTGTYGNSYTVGIPITGEIQTSRQVREWDGQWHRYRVHWKIGNGDGIARFWIDDELVYQRTNFNTADTPGIARLALGRNMNQGPDSEMSYWWGRVRAWDTDPGW